MKPFLTAEWRKLILLTYSVEPALLEAHLPEGLELDTYKGRTFVSFVAFDFLNTKVKGIPIPFHINFPEINLRFYVRRKDADGTVRRGVVFIKELVPRYWVALIARKVYNEPYQCIPMRSTTLLNNKESEILISHHIKYEETEYDFEFTVENQPQMPPPDSTAHFFKEHEWGFGLNRNGQLTEYKVEHPEWSVYPLKKRFKLNIDFGHVYGEQWSFLNTQIPFNVTVAEGSDIKVFPGKVVK